MEAKGIFETFGVMFNESKRVQRSINSEVDMMFKRKRGSVKYPKVLNN